jgi:hypothetical protein
VLSPLAGSEVVLSPIAGEDGVGDEVVGDEVVDPQAVSVSTARTATLQRKSGFLIFIDASLA